MNFNYFKNLNLRRIVSALVVICGFFYFQLTAQQRLAFDGDQILLNLEDNGHMIALDREFSFQFLVCNSGGKRSCVTTGPVIHEKLPLPRKKFKSMLAAQLENPTALNLRYTLTMSERAWTNTVKNFHVIFPSMAHARTKMERPIKTIYRSAYQSSIRFPLMSKHLKDLNLEWKALLFEDMKLFGPLIRPPAIVQYGFANAFENADGKSTTGSELNRQFELLLPLVILVLALVLDHRKVFSFLAILAFCRAMRSVIYSFAYSGEEWVVLSLHFANACVILSTLMYAHFAFFGKLPKKKLTAIFFFCFGSFILLDNFVGKFSTLSDLVADSIAGGYLIIAWGFGIFCFFKEKNSGNQRLESDDPEYAVTLAGVLTLSIALLFTSVNVQDFLSVLQGSTKDLFDPRHQILLPGLLVAGLLDIGSIVKTIDRVRHVIAEKVSIDKELEIGRELQVGLLPDLRVVGKGFRWRCIYKPSRNLAGDWFDIHPVKDKTADKPRFLLVCIADVTGHGISSALMVSNIASHWGQFCNQFESTSIAGRMDNREEMLAVAPQYLNKGLTGMRKNLGCSVAIGLVDLVDRKLTYLTAGHPGVLVETSGKFQYLTTIGTRLGTTGGDAYFETKTIELPDDNHSIIFYTDGLVPLGESVLRWFKQIRRALRANDRSLSGMLAWQLRANFKHFKYNPSSEDDLTLVNIELDSK